ncbi:MAG: bacillithiol biosynthesis BshC, partial [Chryseobacterium sp.]
PNIAYIGGGAEVSYWLQLKANFDFYEIPFPVVLLRNSALVVDKRSADDLADLGFNFEDIFLPVNELQKKWIYKNSQSELSIASHANAIEDKFHSLAEQAASVDGTLRASADSAAAKTKRLLQNLEKKILRAEKRKYAEALNKIENLNKRLFPGGTLQERTVNLAPMFVNYGDDFISSLIENFEPLGGDFTLLLP